jgi:HAE1 family hydrophobic/amphiphilic exporter-1
MRHRRQTMALLGFLTIATIFMMYAMPKGFLPSDDIDQLMVFVEARQGTSFEQMKRYREALEPVIANDPNVRSYSAYVGAGGPSRAGNSARFFIHLKPRGERSKSADEIIADWRPKLNSVPGVRAYLQNPPPIRLGAQFTRSMYQMTLQSPDTDQLFRYASLLEGRLRQVPELRGVNSDIELENPQVTVDINRDKAQALGVSVHAIEDALYYAYGSRQISTIYAPNDQYRVLLEVEPRYQADPSTLSLLYVRSSSGRLVPLDTVAQLERTVGPLTINHSGQLPSATISFDLAPGVSLGPALAKVKEIAAETLPGTITARFQGTAQAFEQSLTGLGVLLLMTILVIYLVLGILYESFIHPITILSGLPAAGFGALLTLSLVGMDLDLFAFVGVIMLVGLVKKNAIMMIDFALDAQRNENKPPAEAIFEGAIIRFRPIMMTTMAALMGVLPIAIGVGPTAASRRPLGVAVLGGLLFSQFLTLYITPVFYTYMEVFVDWLRRWWWGGTAVPAARPGPEAPREAAGDESRRRIA